MIDADQPIELKLAICPSCAAKTGELVKDRPPWPRYEFIRGKPDKKTDADPRP